MIDYQYILTHDCLFPALIGITHTRFEQVHKKFAFPLSRALESRAYDKQRARMPSGGRKPRLSSSRQMLFFILFYYKHYPTLYLLQALFNLDVSNAHRWVRFLEDILHQALGYQLELPRTKARHLGDIIEVCPLLSECLLDATERKINRPKYHQDLYYSGKKKCHTVKNQIFVNPRSKRILSVSDTVESKRHDKQLASDDPTLYAMPPNAKLIADLGYQGLDKEQTRMERFITPYKKSKGKELTDSQKQTNKQISSIRVRVEHPFAFMKSYHILKHQFRGRVRNANKPFINIACIYNFNLAYK